MWLRFSFEETMSLLIISLIVSWATFGSALPPELTPSAAALPRRSNAFFTLGYALDTALAHESSM